MSDVNLLIAEANPDFKIVVCQFPGNSKQYHYKTTLDVEACDRVVVDVQDGFKVVEVLEVIPAIETELSYNFHIKWIVSVVNTEHYEECKLMERAAIKELNRLKYSKRHKELLTNLSETVGEEGVKSVRGLVRL